MDLRPNLSDISLSYDIFTSWEIRVLDDDEFRAAIELIRQCSANLVWTLSPPGDGSIPDDDRILARIAGMRPRQWKRARPKIAQIFRVQGGKWHLDRPWISIGEIRRFTIPRMIARKVSEREGGRCTYCGSTDVPFEIDHIFPVSRGGTNDASNLTLACVPCNRSKGAKTLQEWMADQ